MGFSCGPPSLVVPVCVCVWGFFLWRWSCVFFLSSCWVWGRLLLSLFWCGCCAFSWGTCGFPRRVLQLVTLFGFRTYLAPVSWPTPAVDVYCWVGGVLVHHLVFYLVPAQLPLLLLTLRGLCTLLAPVCWFTPAVEPCYWVGGVFDVSLGFLPCAVLFLWGLPLAQLTLQQVPLGNFRVTGCLSFCFPGDVGWASALPFFFCASPAPAGLQGFAGFCTLCQGAPVGMVSALWTTVSSPCWLSLTLGWVSFWAAVSTVSVGCEVCGLGCPLGFILPFMSLFVLHLLLGWGGLVSGL